MVGVFNAPPIGGHHTFRMTTDAPPGPHATASALVLSCSMLNVLAMNGAGGRSLGEAAVSPLLVRWTPTLTEVMPLAVDSGR